MDAGGTGLARQGTRTFLHWLVEGCLSVSQRLKALPCCSRTGSRGLPVLAHRRADLASGHGRDGRQAPAAQMRLAHHHERPLIYLAYGAEDLHQCGRSPLVCLTAQRHLHPSLG